MKGLAAHPPDRRRSLFSRSFVKASSPSIGLNPAGLEIVVAAVERLSNRGHLFQVPSEGILDDVFGRTSAGRGEIVQCLGGFGRVGGR
jgi:hypothetical protein